MRISEKINNKTILAGIAVVVIGLFILSPNNSIITRKKLKEYEGLDKKIQELDEESSKYYSDNKDKISEYLDLRVKYEDVEKSFYEYKEKYPDDLAEDIEKAKEEVNEYYEKAIKLEHELKEAKAKKQESQIASSNSSTGSYSNGGSSSQSSSSHGQGHKDSSYNKHIGKSVYVSNGNSYYHAISNCKYLGGARTYVVTLTSSMRKYECNCWTNPVVYKKPSSSSSSGGSSNSGGRTVYIASGNSYYHKSSSCKFLRGASVKAVGINNVGGKHPCNCVKY